MNIQQDYQKTLQLSDTDITLIIKALEVYDNQVALMNTGVFPVSDNDLSDINNDSQYLKGLKRHLELQLAHSDNSRPVFSHSFHQT